MLSGLILIFLTMASNAPAQVPEIISYQGVISDAGGTPLNGSRDITVRIYDMQTGGAPIWEETHTGVPINNGVFNVHLGAVNPFSNRVDFSKPYWLGISINDAPELVPRTQFTSTGTALMAKKVMHGGVPAGMIASFAMAKAPSGWLACNGQAVSRATYGELFAAIGTMYGTGNGSTTFNLPDLRGYFLRGWDNGRGIDPDRSSRTNRGDGATGDKVGTKQSDQVRRHKHNGKTKVAGSHEHALRNDPNGDRSGAKSVQLSTSGRNIVRNSSGYVLPAGTHSHSISIYNTGGNETRPKNISVFYCIKY